MDETKVVIDGKEYELIKVGTEQAAQVVELTQWLSRYALPIFQKFSNPQADMGDLSYMDLFSLIVKELSPEALVALHAVMIGCPLKVSQKFFDIGTLVDSAVIIWDKQPGLKRVMNRFFSTPA